MLTFEERHELLAAWNCTQSEYEREACVHDLFEAAAQRTPHATAAVFQNQQLTYKELNTRANRLAHHLRALGVRPDMLVGLCVERSLNMVLGVLAIWKAGGAYVPFDPSYPSERLSFLINDSQITVLLTQADLTIKIPPTPAKIVCLDAIPDLVGGPSGNLQKNLTPENLAYVIYTSGSTGRPKGVAMAHRPLVNLLAWQQRNIPLPVSSRVGQFAPMSFDVSFQEMFSTLCAGATLVIVPEVIRRDPRALLAFLQVEAIQRLFLPFVMLQQLTQAALSGTSGQLKIREIITAGEQLHVTPQLIQFFREFGDCTLHNHYGPTESHVVTSFTLGGPPNNWPPLPPIGRPIANTEVYVLDQNLNLVPIGVAGELYIGGDCLARGYLNRPELTSERFIANPYSAESGARIYKTGDLARYLPDGNLEYLGRLDDQIKLRGFRIELGEIESVLHRMAGVQGAAVLLREDRPGDKRLVAYVVGEPSGQCTAENLRMRLRQKLPDYMVPSAIILLEALPLTPSGKVDRRGLPRPEVERSESEDSFLACRSLTERQLADIWEEILSVKPIGVSDNFFDLGGDSLLGLKLMLQVEKKFGKSFPLYVLYDAPTVGLMSKLITQDSEMRQWPILLPLQPNGSNPPFFWMHGENSNAFLPQYLNPDQPVYALRHQGADGRPARYTTVKEIAAYYVSEIRAVRPQGPYFLGGYCFGGVVAFEVAQKLRKEGHAVPLLVLLAPDRPVNLLAEVSSKASDNEPHCSVGPKVLRSWGTQLQRRLSTFTKLTPRQKVRHLFLKVRGRITGHILTPAKKITRKLACQICFSLGARLPIALRDFYIDSVYEQAAKEYVAESYDGFVVLFKPVQDPVDLTTWQTLVGNGLEIHHIPGTHAEVQTDRGHVKIWAEALMRYLQSPIPKMFTIVFCCYA